MNTYEINARNEVIPYTSGRKCTDTRAWRDATELELQQQDQIQNLERELAAARAEIDGLNFALKQASSIYDAVTEQRDSIDSMYHKIIKEVLECDPIPACQREDDQLEPPWEVIARIRKQRDRLAVALNRIANNNVQDLPETSYAYEFGRMEGIAKIALQFLTTNEQ